MTTMDYDSLWQAAIKRLASRECTTSEIRDYLVSTLVLSQPLDHSSEEEDSSLVEEILTELQKKHFLSDQRYCEQYIRMRSEKGFGPKRIDEELKQKGISAVMIQEQLDSAAIDWSTIAEQVRRKKFGNIDSDGSNEIFTKTLSKQLNFLIYRGFEQEHLRTELAININE